MHKVVHLHSSAYSSFCYFPLNLTHQENDEFFFLIKSADNHRHVFIAFIDENACDFFPPFRWPTIIWVFYRSSLSC